MRRSIHIVAVVLLATAGMQAHAADPAVAVHVPQAGLPAALPLVRGTTISDGGGWKTPLALILLAGTGVAWAGWHRFVRRRLRSPEAAPAQRVVRISSQALTPQASLHAVQWNGEDLLLACTAQQVSVLARRPAGPPREGAA